MSDLGEMIRQEKFSQEELREAIIRAIRKELMRLPEEEGTWVVGADDPGDDEPNIDGNIRLSRMANEIIDELEEMVRQKDCAGHPSPDSTRSTRGL